MTQKLPSQMRVFFTLLVVSLFSCQQQHSNSISIGFVGDILLDRGVRERLAHEGYKNYYESFGDQIPKLDFLVGNLECPVTSIKAPVTKKYIFRAEVENLPYLKKLGFTHLNLANNHSYDQGRQGLIDSERNITNQGLITLGYGINVIEACRPIIIEKEGVKIALFSSVTFPLENWMPLDSVATICQAGCSEIAEAIKTLKQEDPQVVAIVQLHWGVEHITTPTTDQKAQARALIDVGADAIIGHHPHVIQSVETYKGKPIYYSVGNFIFDQRKEVNRKGILVKLTISKDSLAHTAVNYLIKNTKPYLSN